MTGMLRHLAVAFALMATVSGAVASSTAVGAAGSAAVRARAVSWAVKQVGTREIATSNCSPVIDRWERQMGLKLPPCRVWCGAFVHQAFRRAGVQLTERLIDPDRSYADALAGRRGLKAIAISSIERGDIVFYKFREACAPRISASRAGARAAPACRRSRATRATRSGSSAAACATSCSPRASPATRDDARGYWRGSCGSSGFSAALTKLTISAAAAPHQKPLISNPFTSQSVT
jgi:hypothetical protein